MTNKAFSRGSTTLGYNAKSAVLLILGLGLFAGLVALTIETVAGAFESPGTPFLKSEAFRTSDTPFRGWALTQVVTLVTFALAIMSLGAITLVVRIRIAGIASAVCLLVLLGLVLFSPIGRYGAVGIPARRTSPHPPRIPGYPEPSPLG